MRFVFVKSEGEWLPLFFEEICWITKSSTRKNYISVHSGKEVFESKLSLNAIATILPENQFIRVHNSYIIRLDKITKIGSGFAHVKLGEKWIPVGESFVSDLLKQCDFIN
ncbi:LytTR family DNA-binding domain-containing protein [Fluviicola taffensis]|uniref:LytR/AlgR family response regulator transcription factor n=1 Tax=Fluviicola taffensis TaxID=191579 RepID=UPI003137F588